MGGFEHVAAAVLAGGRSTRMGADKASIELCGRTLLERAVEAAGRVFDTVLISGPARYSLPGVPAVPDTEEGSGPIVGILSVLRVAPRPWVFVLPCDSPFVPPEFMRGMASLADDTDVVVPLPSEFHEPLHALYSKRCTAPLESLLAEGKRRIIDLYPRVRTCEVGVDKIRRWDPEGLAFFNLNTPEDLERAGKILAQAGKR